MPDRAPLVKTLSVNAVAVAAGSDLTTIIGEAPFAGTVTAVTYAPVANITGANTDSRTVSVVNKGTDGNGTTEVASLAMVSGVNSNDYDEKAITLSVTAANLVVAEGDVLVFVSTHVGSTGLADPGGRVEVTISAS